MASLSICIALHYITPFCQSQETAQQKILTALFIRLTFI